MVCRRKLWGIKCSLTWKAHRMLINQYCDSFKGCADSLGIVCPVLNLQVEFCARPSSDLNGLYKSPKWRDGLRLWNKGQANFDTVLTDFNSRQFKTWTKKMAAQVNFCLFLNVFSAWLEIRCLKIGTFVLIKVLLTYLNIDTKPLVVALKLACTSWHVSMGKSGKQKPAGVCSKRCLLLWRHPSY